MRAIWKRPPAGLRDALAIAAGAVLLRVVSGVGFANYDTLYALAWGGQLSRGAAPAYGVAIAPTPHPLIEVLGVVLSPLGPSAVENVTVALGFLALSACGWVVYRLGAHWFGRAAGALAALILLTRVPILSYGVRAYVDVPYLLLVLCALLVESRRRRAGAPVLALLALAGLLRPEAWAFSGLYWLYLIDLEPRRSRRRRGTRKLARRPELARLTLLALAAPLVWLLSDLAITGDPLWSLTNTRHTAAELHRVTGIGNVPEYIPRRIGEILRPPVLAGAALGGVLSLFGCAARRSWGRPPASSRSLVFAAFATTGLPINTRYAFLAAAILSVFCGAGVFGWTRLDRADPHRRWWMAAGALVLVALLAYAPVPVPLGPPRTGQTGPPAEHRRRPARARRRPLDHTAVRSGGRSQPRPRPPARPVPEDEPSEHRQRAGQADLLWRLSRPREQGSRRGLRSGPRRSPSGGERAAGLHRGARQPLVARLPAVHLIFQRCS